MTIDYQALREAAEKATQDEWVAYILPGHNGIYPARTSEGRHCGYFIDWPGVCQGRESINMSIRTYAVNCNDAWLNTEGDDISGSYVKYKDHQEVVAALEAKCAALAAENARLKSAVTQQIELRAEIKKAGRPPHADFWVQSICEAEEKVKRALEETQATDAFLAEVRAQGVEMYADNLDNGADDAERGGFDYAVKFLRSEASGVRLFADQLRKGGNQ
ncbi:ead/Ea22-like family protein [Escherichia coli]|uniref:ead/Ea22-like family protein n=1 Tax=Escherichia coli TaxID=562 RepID=UPI000DE2FE19|nr:ead/Ea22-like family protein [Escherichia coli]